MIFSEEISNKAQHKHEARGPYFSFHFLTKTSSKYRLGEVLRRCSPLTAAVKRTYKEYVCSFNIAIFHAVEIKTIFCACHTPMLLITLVNCLVGGYTDKGTYMSAVSFFH